MDRKETPFGSQWLRGQETSARASSVRQARTPGKSFGISDPFFLALPYPQR